MHYCSHSFLDPISIILDASTDTSSNHLLGVLFLTLEKVKPRVHFYRLLDLGYRATAQDHVDKLEAAFKADDILEDMKELTVAWTRFRILILTLLIKHIYQFQF